ncbi:MAG: DUF3025 domain-containing protein [Gallionella sp.]
MKQVPEWDREALLRSPLFVPLHPILAELRTDSFPTLQDCNALLSRHQPPVTVQNGMQLRFVAQQSGKLKFEDQYEPRCYIKGEVATRAYNWHDLLNALVWLTFPRIKAMLNARHYDALIEERASSKGGRSSVRDANTLFDESGVIVVYADAELAELLRAHQWKALFWQRRVQATTGMMFFIFGHGLYAKSLQPYIGMTAQGLLLAIESAFFGWPLAQQLAHLDGLLADYLAAPEHCRSTRDLSPVPLLGVPGWTADNDSAAYYDNTAYFRPGRRG